MKIKIKTDKRENYFILEPIDFNFDSMPKLKIYLRNYEGSRINDGLAYLPINKTNAHRIYSRLSELITRKLRGEIILDEHCKGILREAQEEEQRFEDFAKHAYKIRNNEIDNKEIKEYTAVLSDGGFMRTLKPYQLLSSYHLAFSQNACNFSVPGSGKTSTVLAAYHYLKNIEDTAKHVDKLMVVGPLAAFLAWKSEFTACFGYTPKVLEIYGGINREKVEDELLKSSVDYDMIIVSYGSVPSKVDILQKFLRHNRTMVVLDEAHRIKNTEEGIQSYAALKLSQDAKSRVILTGTPAANNYTDLINLYKFIWPSKNIIGYSKAQLSNMSAYPDERVENLTKNISPFFVRIKKDDLGLPTPIYNDPIKVEMPPIMRI